MKSMEIILIVLVSVTLACGLPNLPNFMPPNITDISTAWAQFFNMTGCHVGQHVAGLSGLKTYLNRFGYMDPVGPGSNASDEFDEFLETALKTYQKNFHLDSTGILDAPTVRQIVRPRCGVPDVINGTNVMNSSSSAGHNGRRLYTFFPGAPRWPLYKRHLTYGFSNTIIDEQTLRSIFSKAFSRWAAATTLTFSEADANDLRPDIVIGFYSGDHGDGEPFDGRLGTLAHAFSPPSGRFHLDAAENWVTDEARLQQSASAIDLESVAVHEIGHLLGLGHSAVEDAIMYPTITSGTKRVELAIDDVAGIQALYGSNPNYNASTATASTSPPSGTQSEREREGSDGVRSRGAVALGSAAAAVIGSLLVL